MTKRVARGAGGGELDYEELKRALHRLSSHLDRFMEAAGSGQVSAFGGKPSEGLRAEQVRRLLAGDDAAAWRLGYELEGHHLALLAAGVGGEEAIRGLGAALGRPTLLVRADRAVFWGWLGGRRPLDPGRLEAAVRAGEDLPEGLEIACGEPGEGISGWRLSHRQAAAAIAVAHRLPGMVRYREVALVAAALENDLLTVSLRRLYLEPLRRERDRGETALRTLRAYFAAKRNVSSAAASLGVHRDTVANRLRAVEAAVGRSLAECASEIELTLRLEDFVGLADMSTPSAP